MGNEDIPSAFTSFTAGAIAGTIVDISLFPLDTVKTRIQAEEGFMRAGGFKQIWKGIGPVAAASAPSAAVFFLIYNESKALLARHGTTGPGCHICSATIAEVFVNLVKVPFEIVKQRRQTSGLTSLLIVREALHNEGIPGLYRGYFSSVIRDIPFSILQYPLWEAMKEEIRLVTGHPTTPAEGALAGAVSGGIAGALTTPLDLAKTRIMLAKDPNLTMTSVLWQIYSTQGIRGLFAGLVPRTVFIFLGGGIFLGAYEFSKDAIEGTLTLTMDFFS